MGEHFRVYRDKIQACDSKEFGGRRDASNAHVKNPTGMSLDFKEKISQLLYAFFFSYHHCEIVLRYEP